MITLWREPPKMDPAASQPSVLSQGDALWLSYRTSRTDHFAIIRFSRVEAYRLGDPDDPSLPTRPLWGEGLEPNSFHEVSSPELRLKGLRRWVVTFRDETLDVTAREAGVVVRAIQARDGDSALAMVRG